MKLTTFSALAALLGLSGAPQAWPATDGGEIDLTLCWSGPLQLLAPVPGERFASYHVSGLTSSAGNLTFDALALQCVGAFEVREAAYAQRGFCVFEDAAGDRLYGRDTIGADGYRWQWLGGTGKFAGITGGGTLERIGEQAPPRDGVVQGCRRMSGQYGWQP